MRWARLLCSGTVLAALACRPAASAPAARVVASSPAKVAIAPTEAPPPLPPAKARTWRMSPDSPFFLVGENLKGAGVQQLGARTVVHAWRCGDDPRVIDGRPALHLNLWNVEGDRFSSPLPTAPPVVVAPGERPQLAGRWPSDLHVLFSGARDTSDDSPQDQGVLLHWDGRAWSENLPPAERNATIPAQLLPWWDDAALVGRRMHFATASLGPPSFAVVGRTKHVPPDFSKAIFPKPRGLPSVTVTYAVLPTQEAFVLNITSASGRSIASLGRASADGEIAIDTLLDIRGSLSGRLATGKLGERDVVAVALEPVTPSAGGPKLSLFDRRGRVDLSEAFNLPASPELIRTFTFAGGKLWLSRGRQVYCSEGAALHPCGKLPTYQEVYPASDGAWSGVGSRLTKLEPTGELREVPFVEGAEGKLMLWAVVPIAADDVWLVAETPERESLLFRTKPMLARLGCHAR